MVLLLNFEMTLFFLYNSAIMVNSFKQFLNIDSKSSKSAIIKTNAFKSSLFFKSFQILRQTLTFFASHLTYYILFYNPSFRVLAAL